MKIPDDALLRSVKPPERRRADYYYYKEEYALAAKQLLDKLHSSGNPVRIPLSGCSIVTVRLQYYQGVKYLVDHLDTNGYYKKLYERTVCRNMVDHLLLTKRITSRNALADASEVVPWKEELEEFFDTAVKDQKFFREGLNLLPEDLAWIDGQLSTMTKESGEPLFFGEIKPDHILLIKDA